MNASFSQPLGQRLPGKDEVCRMVRHLLDGWHAGILATVSADQGPQLRWMSTLSFEDFPVFHSLTAPGSRKVVEIQNHPSVTWQFFDDDMNCIVNLFGKARILTGEQDLELAWQKVNDLSHAYFLNQFGHDLRFVVIETKVETIECLIPEAGYRGRMDPYELCME